jgi:hypothetical protein
MLRCGNYFLARSARPAKKNRPTKVAIVTVTAAVIMHCTRCSMTKLFALQLSHRTHKITPRANTCSLAAVGLSAGTNTGRWLHRDNEDVDISDR